MVISDELRVGDECVMMLVVVMMMMMIHDGEK